MNKVLSGMRPTGRLHLGNYLGATLGMLELQNDPKYETLYMVADGHAITTPYDPKELKQKRREVVIDYLAAGLDPKKSTIFLQSHVPETFELNYYLSSVITIARLQHLPTFKEKVKQYPQHNTMALLNYPVLMAADILLYKANSVPVGIDQEPHLEIARQIARNMNDRYGTSFPEPGRFEVKGTAYIPSLTGEGKMSKSVEGSYINLVDDLETIKNKLAKVPTDSGSGSEIPTDGGVFALMEFVGIFEGIDKRKEYEEMYLGDGLRYSEVKSQLAEAIFATLQPIQEKRAEIVTNEGYVDDVLLEGAKQARSSASETLGEVRSLMGF